MHELNENLLVLNLHDVIETKSKEAAEPISRENRVETGTRNGGERAPRCFEGKIRKGELATLVAAWRILHGEKPFENG
jgi:hypothetical protein